MRRAWPALLVAAGVAIGLTVVAVGSRGWGLLTVVAGWLGLVHGVASFLGALGLGATSDGWTTAATPEKVAATLAVLAVAVGTLVGVYRVFSAGDGSVLLVAGVVSLALSGYFLWTFARGGGGFSGVPVVFAVLPTLQLGLLLVPTRVG